MKVNNSFSEVLKLVVNENRKVGRFSEIKATEGSTAAKVTGVVQGVWGESGIGILGRILSNESNV